MVAIPELLALPLRFKMRAGKSQRNEPLVCVAMACWSPNRYRRRRDSSRSWALGTVAPSCPPSISHQPFSPLRRSRARGASVGLVRFAQRCPLWPIHSVGWWPRGRKQHFRTMSAQRPARTRFVPHPGEAVARPDDSVAGEGRPARPHSHIPEGHCGPPREVRGWCRRGVVSCCLNSDVSRQARLGVTHTQNKQAFGMIIAKRCAIRRSG